MILVEVKAESFDDEPNLLRLIEALCRQNGISATISWFSGMGSLLAAKGYGFGYVPIQPPGRSG